MTDTSREAVEHIRTYLDHPYTHDDILLLNSDLVNITSGDLRALLTRAETAEARLAEAVKGLRKLDRRMDALDTFDLRVHEIVSETLAKIKGETNDE